MNTKILLIFLCLISLNAFGEAFDEKNQPEIFREGYKKNFVELPTKGGVDTPWSGDYWPTYKGGITYRWKCPTRNKEQRYAYPIGERPSDLSCLSPAEKLDLYLGDPNWTLTRYERKRTNVMKTVKGSDEYDKEFEIPTWEGLCHAWAPATIAYANPSPILVTNPSGLQIPFGSSDLKALLTYGIHLENARLIPSLANSTQFAGQRCSEEFKKLKEQLDAGEITREEYEEKINSGKCGEDINAGSFHLILTNEIGILKKAFVIDMTRDSEVWNQPVFDFEVKNLPMRRPFNVMEGAAEGTFSHRKVEVKIKMIVEVSQSWNKEVNPRAVKEKVYQYYLDLDYDGNIIGGKWISFDRPDFVWAKKKVSAFESIFQNFETVYKKSIEEEGLLLNRLRGAVGRVGFKNTARKLAIRAFLEMVGEFGNKDYGSLLFDHIEKASMGEIELDLELVKKYLRRKANPNHRPSERASELNLLHAVKLKNIELVKLLVERGAHSESREVILEAVKLKRPKIVKVLFENGAKPYWEKSDYGLSGRLPAIFQMAYSGNWEMLQVFLQFGAKVDIGELDKYDEGY